MNKAEERAAFERVKREILQFIELVRQQSPEGAAYFEQHLVMDEQNLTFTYTGDRFQLTRLPALAPDLANARRVEQPSTPRPAAEMPPDVLKREVFQFKDQAGFDDCRQIVQQSIQETRQEDPETADYLEQHMVFDEKKLTFVYTGDPIPPDSSLN